VEFGFKLEVEVDLEGEEVGEELEADRGFLKEKGTCFGVLGVELELIELEIPSSNCVVMVEASERTFGCASEV